MSDKKYIPALSLNWLTPLYDSLVEGPMSALRMRKDLLSQMGDLYGKRVLDVGCGTGSFSFMMKKRYPAAEIVGLDGDPHILEIAQSKAKNYGCEIRFDHGLSTDLPYPDASFDYVITSMMLHHLDRSDKQKTAQETYRVLGSGGQLFGLDFGEARGLVGKALQPMTRHFERITDNLDGFMPVMFQEAGFKDYSEPHRYLFGSLSLFRCTKD